MTQFVFANGVQTTLAAGITATDTTLVVSSTANLPTIAAGQQCPAVLGTTALFEIVYITNINSSTLTITRGQENTAAQSWGLGTQFEISVTAGSIAAAQIIGTLGGALAGTLPNPGLESSVVAESNLAGGSVHQGQLSTATASGNVSAGPNGGVSYTLTGGNFAWYSMSGSYYDNGSDYGVWVVGNGATSAGTLGFQNFPVASAGGTITVYINETYVNSSPPYTEGPLFVYMGFNKAGERTHICVAPDPTWAHHGPTSLIPHFKEKGLGYRNIRMVDDVPCSVIARDVKHPLFKRYLSGDTHEVAVPIDLKYKDSDRDLEPHPWHHTPSDTQFCLLEPGSDLMVELHQIYQDSDADNVRKIVEDYVKVGAVTDKNAPKGMVIRRAQWRIS